MSIDMKEFIQAEMAGFQDPDKDDFEMALEMSVDSQYCQLLRVLAEARDGSMHHDRTGVGTIRRTGNAMFIRSVLANFPILESKFVSIKTVLHELLWFLKGNPNIQYLKENGVKIWDEWADADGNLGPIYPQQWRAWPDTKLLFDGDQGFAEKYQALLDRGYVCRGSYEAGETSYYEYVMHKEIDQVQNIVDTLINNPDSRRMVCSAWNVGDLPDMNLHPCHIMWQVLSDSDRESRAFDHNMSEALGNPKKDRVLDLVIYQRSADTCLGSPYNIASYAALLQILAELTGHVAGSLVYLTGDTHVYTNHFEGAATQLAQYEDVVGKMATGARTIPRLVTKIPAGTKLEDLTIDMFDLVGYAPEPKLKFDVAV